MSNTKADRIFHVFAQHARSHQGHSCFDLIDQWFE